MTVPDDRRDGEFLVQPVPLDRLEVSESNVRRREITAELDELADSMRRFGLQQPIVVQRRGDRFHILIGQRRYLAAKQLGWHEIPARIYDDGLSDLQAKAISFNENVQRRDLDPRDKADACSFLVAKLGTVREAAGFLGVSETTVRKWLGYAAVPKELKAMVERGAITRPVATRLAQQVTNEQTAVAIAEKIAELNPPRDQRERIIDAAVEDPNRSVDVILSRAEQTRARKEIRFILPERWGAAIGYAAADLDREPEDIAKDATIEWLQQHQY